MPSPAPNQMNVAGALQSLQKQVDQLARRPAGAGGGGPLGTAYYTYTWTGTVASNGADHFSSGVTIDATTGDMGDLATSGAPITGVFLVVATLRFQPTTNAVTSDVHMMRFGFPAGGEQSECAIGTQPANLHGSGFTDGFYGVDPADCFLNARCTGGTNRVYDGPPSSPASPIMLNVGVVRFPGVA